MPFIFPLRPPDGLRDGHGGGNVKAGGLSIPSTAVAKTAQSSADRRRSVQSEIEKRHDEASNAQEWVKHQALAAEDEGMDEGCDDDAEWRGTHGSEANAIDTDGHQES